MYVSVPIGSCGSWHPVVTHKPLWESPGTELSTWSIGSFCCIRAIQRTRLASRPLRSYTVLYSYTALDTIQLYIAIHYTTYATLLCAFFTPYRLYTFIPPRATVHTTFFTYPNLHRNLPPRAEY